MELKNFWDQPATQRAGLPQVPTTADAAMDTSPVAPRNVRNNNPGNIVASNIPWEGKTGNDGHFEVFDTPENGLKAMSQNLLSYSKKYGLNTVEGLISRWAPSSENNTPAYIAHVASMLGVSPTEPIDVANPLVRAALSEAITKQEGGSSPYTTKQHIDAAWGQHAPEDVQTGPGWSVNPDNMIPVDMPEAPREKRGVLATLGHGLERAALPLAAAFAAGAPGAEAGAALGAGGGPVGMAVGGAIGGLVTGLPAGWAAATGQNEVLKANPGFAEAIGQDPTTQAEEAQDHPVAAWAGEQLPQLLLGNPLKPGGAIRMAANAALGAGMELGGEIANDQPVDLLRIGGAAAVQAFSGEPNRVGRAIAGLGNVITPDVLIAHNAALRAKYAPPVPVPEPVPGTAQPQMTEQPGLFSPEQAPAAEPPLGTPSSAMPGAAAHQPQPEASTPIRGLAPQPEAAAPVSPGMGDMTQPAGRYAETPPQEPLPVAPGQGDMLERSPTSTVASKYGPMEVLQRIREVAKDDKPDSYMIRLANGLSKVLAHDDPTGVAGKKFLDNEFAKLQADDEALQALSAENPNMPSKELEAEIADSQKKLGTLAAAHEAFYSKEGIARNFRQEAIDAMAVEGQNKAKPGAVIAPVEAQSVTADQMRARNVDQQTADATKFTDSVVQGSRDQRTAAAREEIIQRVLDDNTTRNPTSRIRTELRKAGFRELSLTESEQHRIAKFEEARDAFAALQEKAQTEAPAAPERIPASPDEGNWAAHIPERPSRTTEPPPILSQGSEPVKPVEPVTAGRPNIPRGMAPENFRLTPSPGPADAPAIEAAAARRAARRAAAEPAPAPESQSPQTALMRARRSWGEKPVLTKAATGDTMRQLIAEADRVLAETKGTKSIGIMKQAHEAFLRDGDIERVRNTAKLLKARRYAEAERNVTTPPETADATEVRPQQEGVQPERGRTGEGVQVEGQDRNVPPGERGGSQEAGAGNRVQPAASREVESLRELVKEAMTQGAVDRGTGIRLLHELTKPDPSLDMVRSTVARGAKRLEAVAKTRTPDVEAEQAAARVAARRAEIEARQRAEDEDAGRLRAGKGRGQGVDVETAQRAVDEHTAGWRNKPEVRVVKSVADLPGDLRERAPSDTKGAFAKDGKLYVVADNARDVSDVKATIFHEMLGHYGMQGRFGKALTDILARAYKTNPKIREAADAWIEKQMANRESRSYYSKLTPEQLQRVAVEEILAERSEAGATARAGLRGTFDKIVAAVRQFARARGMDVDYSDNDVAQILRKSHDFVLKGEGAPARPDERLMYTGRAAQMDKATHNRFQTAQTMEKAGADNETIRRATGWHRAADGEWRHELSDYPSHVKAQSLDWLSNGLRYPEFKGELTEAQGREYWKMEIARKNEDHPNTYTREEINALMTDPLDNIHSNDVNRIAYELGLTKGTNRDSVPSRMEKYAEGRFIRSAELQDLMHHPKLYEAYPELRTMRVGYDPKVTDRGGSYSDQGHHWLDETLTGPSIELNGHIRDAASIRETLLHEVQHHIQSREGFDTGRSWEEMTPMGFVEQFNTAPESSFLNKLQSYAAAVLRQDPAWVYGDARFALTKNGRLIDGAYRGQLINEAIDKIQAAGREWHEMPDSVKYTSSTKGFHSKEGDRAERRVYDAVHDLGDIIDIPKTAYLMSHGEVEARDTSVRADMGADKRRFATPLSGVVKGATDSILRSPENKRWDHTYEGSPPRDSVTPTVEGVPVEERLRVGERTMSFARDIPTGRTPEENRIKYSVGELVGSDNVKDRIESLMAPALESRTPLDVFENITGALRRKKLEFMPLGWLQSRWGKDLTTISTYNDENSLKGAHKKHGEFLASQPYSQWTSLKEPEQHAVSELLLDGSYARVDVRTGEGGKTGQKPEVAAELAARYKALSPEARATVDAVREGYDTDLNTISGQMKTKMLEHEGLEGPQLRDTQVLLDEASDNGLNLTTGNGGKGMTAEAKADLLQRYKELSQQTKDVIDNIGGDYRDLHTRFKSIKGYFPLMRFGDFLAISEHKDYSTKAGALQELETKLAAEKDPKAREALQEQVSDARDKLNEFASTGGRYVEAFKTEAEMTRRVKQMQEAGYDSRARLASEYQAHVDSVSSGFMRRLNEGFDREASRNPETSAGIKGMKSIVNQLYLDSLPETSVAKRQMQRQDVQGFSRDAQRVYATSRRRNAGFIAELTHGYKVRDALDQMQRQASRMGIQQQEVAALFAKHFNALHTYAHTPYQTFFNQATYAYMLGGSVSFNVMHIMQTPLVTAPMMAGHYGWGRTGVELGRALADLSGDGFKSVHGGNEALLGKTPAEQKSLRFALAHDAISGTEADQFINAARNNGTLSNVGHSIMTAAGFLPHYTEKSNRLVTWLAAHRMAMSDPAKLETVADSLGIKVSNKELAEFNDGKPPAEQMTKTELTASKYAEKITLDSHVDYSRENAPYIMQPGSHGAVATKLFYQFQKYQFGMMQMLAENYQHMANPQAETEAGRALERKAGFRTLLGVIGTHAVSTGAMGLPGFGLAAFVANAYHKFFGDKDQAFDAEVEFRNAIAEHLGRDASDVVARGLLYAPGIRQYVPADITDRLGMGDLVTSGHALGTIDRNNLLQYIGGAMFGPAGTLGGNVADMYKFAHQGDYWKAMEQVLPKSLRDLAKVARFNGWAPVENPGVTTASGKRVLGPEEITGPESFVQAIGFEPQRVEESYAQRAGVNEARAQLAERRKILIKRFAEAKLAGDDKEAANVMDLVKAYNAHQQEKGLISERLQFGTLYQAVAERRMENRRLKGGIALSPRQRALRAEYGGFSATAEDQPD